MSDSTGDRPAADRGRLTAETARLLQTEPMELRPGLRSAFTRRLVARQVDLAVHPTALFGKVQISTSGERAGIRVGARSVIEDGVRLNLVNGARLVIGEDVVIRSGAVLNLAGVCEFKGRNLLSWYSVVHCAYSVIFDVMAGTGEGVTVVDSTHFHGPEGAVDEHWHANHRPGYVHIGPNTWLATKSTVSANVTLAARTTVAGHAFVRAGSYPPGVVLAGVPAQVIRV